MSRKVFKELQHTSINKNRVKMSITPDDELQKFNASVSENDRSKENVGALRRSKRKNAGSEIKSKKTSKEGTKKLASKKVVSKKSKAQVKKVSCETTSNLDLISEVGEDSNMVNPSPSVISNVIKDSVLIASPNLSATSEEVTTNDMYSVLLNKSVSEDISLMTSVKPPEKYWEMLAEERRIALEKALYENESLHDELLVLETEIKQLRSAVDAAEKVLQAVGLLN